MIFRDIMEPFHIRAADIAIVTLATDGFKPGKDHILMLAARRWEPTIQDRSPDLTQHVLIEGGDPSETVGITGITPDIYMTQAISKEEAATWFLELMDDWGTTCLAGHSALRYMKPFLEILLKSSERFQYLDTQLMSKIYHHRRWTLNDKILSANQFMTENSRLSFPRDPGTSLDAMLEHFGIEACDLACPYTAVAKSVETSEVLKRLWEVPI